MPLPVTSEDAQKLGLKPEHAPRLMRLAMAELDAQHLDDAEAAAFVAASADGSKAEHWLVLGLCRARLQKYAEAKAAFDRAVALDAKNIGAWTNLGEVQIGLKDFSAAATALQKAVELDPSAQHAASRRARMLLVTRAQWRHGLPK